MAGDISKVNTQISSNTSQTSGTREDTTCPYCGGMGYLRKDLPIDHPDFGKLVICSCREVDVTRKIHQKLYDVSKLDRLGHLSFDNFNTNGRLGTSPLQIRTLTMALETAQAYARNLTGWLLLEGGFGCGKTHLAAAVANFAVSLGVPSLFLTVPDLLDTLRFAFSEADGSFEERFEQIRNIGLLVMDDFGTHNATEWAQEKLFQIINYRYINRLPTVVTTNIPMQDFESRIRSRLQDPELVAKVSITAPDYRNPVRSMYGTDSVETSPLRKSTFVNFSMRRDEGIPEDQIKSLEKALQATQNFARFPKGWLVLVGKFGCGKSHLANAISSYLEETGQEHTFIHVPEFLDRLRATYSTNSEVSFDREFYKVRNDSILILDDLGTRSMTSWVRDKIHQLFIYRFDNQLATVITTADSIEDMDERIRTRIINRNISTIYAITAPPYPGTIKPKSTFRTTTRKRKI
jgi:DNA replication protein DnaC